MVMQYSHMRFVFADADFLPELAADVRFTPTFAVYQRGKKVCACVVLCDAESLTHAAARAARWTSGWGRTHRRWRTGPGCGADTHHNTPPLAHWALVLRRPRR